MCNLVTDQIRSTIRSDQIELSPPPYTHLGVEYMYMYIRVEYMYIDGPKIKKSPSEPSYDADPDGFTFS